MLFDTTLATEAVGLTKKWSIEKAKQIWNLIDGYYINWYT